MKRHLFQVKNVKREERIKEIETENTEEEKKNSSPILRTQTRFSMFTWIKFQYAQRPLHTTILFDMTSLNRFAEIKSAKHRKNVQCFNGNVCDRETKTPESS